MKSSGIELSFWSAKTARRLLGCTLALAMATGCVRFKVDKLSTSELFNVPVGESVRRYAINRQGGFPVNMPHAVFEDSDRIYLPNLEKGTVQVFDTQGRLRMLLGPDPDAKNKDYKVINFPFSQVVQVVPGADDSFYVQNRIAGKADDEEEEEDGIKGPGIDLGPLVPYSSYILHFSEEGRLIASIGQQGKNSAPFGYIERMNVDSEGRLIVLHHFGLEKVLTWYDGKGNVISEIAESSLEIEDSDAEEFAQEFEDLMPFPNGENFLVSIAFREKDQQDDIRFRLKSRRIYKFSRKSPEGAQLMLEISDPREALFWTNSDQGFYVWQNENSTRTIRLQVYDSEGTHVNNKLIEFTGPRSNWREIYADLRDNIYSLYSDDNSLKLYAWN